ETVGDGPDLDAELLGRRRRRGCRIVEEPDLRFDAVLAQCGLDLRMIGMLLGSLRDRKSTRLNSSHVSISYAVFCLKKKNTYRDICHLLLYNQHFSIFLNVY